MSEPIERLSRFTPDAGGLDRDALLFKAGRASARPSRRWHALCATLATTQLLTLGLAFWPGPPLPVPGDMPALVIVRDTPPPTAPTLLQLQEQALATEGNLPAPAPVEQPFATEPPLHAFGPLPTALFN